MDSCWNIIFTGILLVALLIGVQSGLLGVAIALTGNMQQQRISREALR